MRALATVAAAFALAACQPAPPVFTEPRVLGGVEVPAATLEHGRRLYLRSCASCHGADGSARTPLARQLDPPPRAFTDGRFPRSAGDAGRRPSDADLAQVVRGGVPGTAMPGWAHLAEPDVAAIVHYIKTFSRRWASPGEAANKPLPPDNRPDTVRARRAGGAWVAAMASAATSTAHRHEEPRLEVD